MEEKTFEKPRLAINRVYTRQGDEGETGLAGGQRVPKDGRRIEAYGTVDELNSFHRLARVTASGEAGAERLAAILLRVQHELFNLGSILATAAGGRPSQAGAGDGRGSGATGARDGPDERRSARRLRSFVLPGGSRLNAELHVCRTVCRRAERACVALARVESIPPEAIRYLNRLSDALFVWSRWASHVTGTPETLWEPNQATSGVD